MAGDAMHDDVKINPEVEERALRALRAWGDASNDGIARLVAGLSWLVYSAARQTGESDAAAWERVQQVVVGEGVGGFEEALEDARNE